MDTRPFSTSRTSNYVARAGGLPDYVRGVAHALLRKGRAKTESQAIQMAVGILEDWASGRGKVRPQIRAAAAKAVAEFHALPAKARAANLAVEPADTVDLAKPYRYRHGWIPVFTGRHRVEDAARAVISDGHAAIHGTDMVATAHDVIQRLHAKGVHAQAHRIDLAGTPHIRVYNPARKNTDLSNGAPMEIRASQIVDLANGQTVDLTADVIDLARKPRLHGYVGFKRLKKALAAKGAVDPAALAAYIGRKKYGRAGFAALSAKGHAKGAAK